MFFHEKSNFVVRRVFMLSLFSFLIFTRALFRFIVLSMKTCESSLCRVCFPFQPQSSFQVCSSRLNLTKLSHLFIYCCHVLKLTTSTRSFLFSCSPLLESVELLISLLGSVARVIIFLQMLEFGKEPKGSGEREGNGRKTSCRHYQFHPSTSSHLLLPARGSQYHLLHSTELFPPPHSFSVLHILPLPVSQEAARAGCVYCWGNWSSLERAWPWPPLRPKIYVCMCVYTRMCEYNSLWWLTVRPGKESRPLPVSAH